jgi:hypothetical protein
VNASEFGSAEMPKSGALLAKLAVSVMGPFMVTDARFAVPEYEPDPLPVHEPQVYPPAELGKAWMLTVQ